MARLLRTSLVLTGSALVLASCGSATSSATSTSTSGASTTTTATTRNLAVTAAVRQNLLSTGAKFHQLPTRDFIGLDKGTVYYAFDPADATFYAAAGLDPSPSSLQAQVSTEDDGAYNLFVRHAGATAWTVYNDGLGAAKDSTCPVVLPASVLAAWGWKPKSCFPPV